MAVLFDCGVWYYVKGLEIYDEKTKEEADDFKKVNSEENDKHLLTELMKPINSSNLDSWIKKSCLWSEYKYHNY